MSKTTLVFFWVIWLLDVLMALFGYREFINGVFGQYAVPSSKYLVLWAVLLVAFLLILFGSLYFKNHERPSAALIVAAIPLVLALPYALFMAAVLISGNNRWN
jgi:predicted neutral ceramidase superfamily lipid hydrolase